MPRNLGRTVLLLTTLVAFDVLPAAAQRPAGSGRAKVYVTAAAGRFVDMGGFSDDQDTYFSYDDANAFGGGLHLRSGGAVLGVDVLYSRPGYTRFDRSSLETLSTGQATVIATMASARLTGGAGGAGVFLAGGAGAFFWDVAELGGRDTDPALTIGVGLDYALRGGIILFGEYGRWWVYHQKDETVQKNTASHTLIRAGLRFGF